MATPPQQDPAYMVRQSQEWRVQSIKDYERIVAMLTFSSTTYEESQSCGCHTFGYANGFELRIKSARCVAHGAILADLVKIEEDRFNQGITDREAKKKSP